MKRNFYEQCETRDIYKSMSFIENDQINLILREAADLAGPGIIPERGIDTENHQVIDYRCLDRVNDDHRALMDKLHSELTHDTDDLALLALTSMFTVIWHQAETTVDVSRAAVFETALYDVLTRWSRKLGSKLKANDALLPNWGRINFLHVMGKIHERAIEEHGLKTVACTLLKLPTLEARSYDKSTHSLIGLTFALKPILESFNKFVLYSQHSTDPNQIALDWSAIAPTILNLCGGSPVTNLPKNALLFDEGNEVDAHFMVSYQLDFIVARELGHIVLGHAKKSEQLAGNEFEETMPHRFEFDADVFALNIWQSALINELRESHSHPCCDGASFCPRCTAIFDHDQIWEAAYMLFTYLGFIENASGLLRNRLKGTIQFEPTDNIYPPTTARLDNLKKMNFGHCPNSTTLQVRAEKLFRNLLSHVESLDDDALLASVQGSVPKPK